MKIVVDSREAVQAKGIVENLRRLKIDVEVNLLAAGDYLVGDLLIERKTPTGLVSDIRSKRLWDELEKLKGCEGLNPLIVIEGSLSLVEKLTKWSPSQVIGVINSIILDWDLHVIVLPSRKWFITYLYQLAKRFEAKAVEVPIPLRAKEKFESISDRIRFVVEGLPNVSGVRAINLLRRFKTIKALANASLDELKSVKGIGEKTAKAIYEVLNAEFEE